jgi:serine/threonine protein kinase
MALRDPIANDYRVLAIERNAAVKMLQPPEAETLPIGSIIDGKYQVLGIAGKGGMGVVYAAQHIQLNRVVAVKLLKREYCANDLVFRRFLKEAQAASLLHHPNIVAVHDFVMRAGVQAYLVMDFLDGTSLLQEITPEKPLALHRFHNIFIQACDALAHAHKFGLVHRDIKPSNLLLSERDGRKDHLTIVDFGLVKLMSMLDDQKITTTNTLIGSPVYMSPEQCTRVQVDHRSDIYSLGCTMYEALTGYLPHHGATPLETFCKHVTEEPLPLNERNPSIAVPAQLEQVILKCLAKNPGDRYQSMDELRVDLERSLMQLDAVPRFRQMITIASAKQRNKEKSRSQFRLNLALFATAAAALGLGLLAHSASPLTNTIKQPARHIATAHPTANPQPEADQFATGFPDVDSLPLNPGVSATKQPTKKSKPGGHRGYHWVRYYRYYYYR